MTRTRLDAPKRKAQIVLAACRLANEKGLSSVSYLTIAPLCPHIEARGIRYHFPNKVALYQAMIDSDELTIKTMRDAEKIGLIKINDDATIFTA